MLFRFPLKEIASTLEAYLFCPIKSDFCIWCKFAPPICYSELMLRFARRERENKFFKDGCVTSLRKQLEKKMHKKYTRQMYRDKRYNQDPRSESSQVAL